MGRCCSLFTRSTCRNPRLICTHHHRAAVHLLYPIPYASIFMEYILLPPPTCFFCSYSPSTCNSNPMSTVYTKLFLYVSCIYHMMFVYILCTSTTCMLCTFTLCMLCTSTTSCVRSRARSFSPSPPSFPPCLCSVSSRVI